ncbi:MAG: hypothetical protein QQN63_02510 [Nitrosopumilus sp.]
MPDAVTIAEARKVTKDEARRGVMEIIEQNAPIVALLPWETVSGMSYSYLREAEIPSATSRNVNSGYTPEVGALEKIEIPLKIIGGEFDVDQFLIDQGGDLDDIFARQMALRHKSNAFHMEELIFEGNSLTTAANIDGLRTLIGGNQLIAFSTVGAALTVASIETLLDAVPGAEYLWMNRTLRTDLLQIISDSQAASGRPQVHYENLGGIGKPIEMYNNAKIMVVERLDDGSTILDFNEDPGDAGSDTASIYAARIGKDALFGIQGKRGPTDSRELGEDWDEPRRKGRSEWYSNIVIAHPRSVGRSFGFLDV